MEFVLITFLVSCLINYGVFLWSAVVFFEEKENQFKLLFNSLKFVSVLFWVTSIIFIFTDSHSFYFLFFGAAVNFLALTLFVFSARYIKNQGFSAVYGKDIPNTLVTTGPYKYVRNPFYLTYCMTYLGVSLSLRSWSLFLLFITLLGMYLVAIRLEENKFVYSDNFRAYHDYKLKTGKLIPKIKLFKSEKNKVNRDL